MEKFIIAATQRSGTTFFRYVLNQHPDLHIFDELFLDDLDNKIGFYQFWQKKIADDPRNLTYNYAFEILRTYLDNLTADQSAYKAVGIDIKYNQYFIIPWQMNLLARMGFKIIHVIRRNILKTLISDQLNKQAEQLGRNSHGTQSVNHVKVKLPADQSIINELERRRNEIFEFRRHFTPFDYLELYYEDFFSDENFSSETLAPAVIKRVCSFLGVSVPDTDLVTGLKKTNPDDLRDLISNYDELHVFLDRHGWGGLCNNQLAEVVA